MPIIGAIHRRAKGMAAPQQNIVYADADGHIGFIAPARIPIRAKGDGWLPVSRSHRRFCWTQRSLRRDGRSNSIRHRPPATAITASCRKITPIFLAAIGTCLPRRALFEMLDQHPALDMDGAAAMQGDDLADGAQPDAFAADHQSGDRARQGGARLVAQWDFRMDPAARSPRLRRWLREIQSRAIAESLGDCSTLLEPQPNVVQGFWQITRIGAAAAAAMPC